MLAKLLLLNLSEMTTTEAGFLRHLLLVINFERGSILLTHLVAARLGCRASGHLVPHAAEKASTGTS